MGHFEIFDPTSFFSDLKMMVLRTIGTTKDAQKFAGFQRRDKEGNPQRSFGRAIGTHRVAGQDEDGRHASFYFWVRGYGGRGGGGGAHGGLISWLAVAVVVYWLLVKLSCISFLHSCSNTTTTSLELASLDD